MINWLFNKKISYSLFSPFSGKTEVNKHAVTNTINTEKSRCIESKHVNKILSNVLNRIKNAEMLD